MFELHFVMFGLSRISSTTDSVAKYINFQNFRTFNFRTFNFRTKIFGRNFYRFRTISDNISDILKQVNKISEIYDLIPWVPDSL